MDMLRSNISDEKTLFQLNCCRLQLQVVTLADIVELSGKRVLNDCLVGRNMRHSNLNWPKQIVPVGWWNLWSSYLSSVIVPYIRQHTLGPVINTSHQSWPWKINASKKIVSNCKLQFRLLERNNMTRIKKFERVDVRIPARCNIPVDVSIQSDGKLCVLSTYDIKVNQKKIRIRKLIPSQVSLEVNSHSHHGGVTNPVDKYKFLREHVYTNTKRLRKMSRAYKKNSLIIATDGSAKLCRSSFGYCIARQDGKILLKAHSPVLVDPEYHFSDRAELLAILAATSHIGLLEKMFPLRLQRRHSIQLHTDSESSLLRIEDEASNSTKTVLNSNLDVLFEIKKVRKNLKAKINFFHVDSHQDEDCPFEDLPLPARLNTIADSLASKEYAYPPPSLKRVMPHLEANVITFRNNHHRLTSNITNELIRLRRDFDGEKAALKRWNIKKSMQPKLIGKHWIRA